MTKQPQILARFTEVSNAMSFSMRTVKASAVIMGDDEKFWVVSLGTMSFLEKAGYEVVRTPSGGRVFMSQELGAVTIPAD